ncbi:MAG: helix-turn-helix domain-containing protein [Treponematales bacterium]
MRNLADFFKQIRISAKMSQAEFAKRMGVSQRTWSSYERGETVPKEAFLIMLQSEGYKVPGLTDEEEVAKQEFEEEEEGISEAVEEHWRQVRKVTEGRPVPLYTQDDFADGNGYEVPLLNQKLSAGKGVELPDKDEADAFVRVPARLKRYGKNLAALAVEGDSMYPTLDRGDLVVCDSCGWSGEGIYAIRMNGEGYVKRITHDPGKILLISDNPKYPIREYQEDIDGLEIIGRVHCAIKNLE